MNEISWDITTLAHVIQVAVAPVFLLAGISALLGVMTNRLGRITDRARTLQGWMPQTEKCHAKRIEEELNNLLLRGRVINFAITLATTSALLVCLVIMVLFLSSLISMNLSIAVAVLFIICMFVMSCALAMFLAEILIATRFMRNGIVYVEAALSSPVKPE